MTQILSFITPKFVIQASDRRLTNLNTGESMTWKANKTVVVPPVRMMFSYTGLAQLTPIMTTDGWLMKKCFELRDSENYVEAIAQAASEIFKTIKLPKEKKRHAFVGVGWLPDSFETIPPQPVGFQPGAFCVLISNFIDDAGNEIAEARKEFQHRVWPLQANQEFGFLVSGAPLTESELWGLDKNLRSALRSPGGAERAASVLLLKATHETAARDQTVGGGAFISSISRDHIPGGPPALQGMSFMGMQWGLPESSRATFLHVPEEQTEAVESPAIVGDPFAGKMMLAITKGGERPSLAGPGAAPEEGSFELKLIALRSSDEIEEMTGGGRVHVLRLPLGQSEAAQDEPEP
jgi:hypothetical protein